MVQSQARHESDDGKNPCVLVLNTISSTIRWPHAAMTNWILSLLKLWRQEDIGSLKWKKSCCCCLCLPFCIFTMAQRGTGVTHKEPRGHSSELISSRATRRVHTHKALSPPWRAMYEKESKFKGKDLKNIFRRGVGFFLENNLQNYGERVNSFGPISSAMPLFPAT